VEQAEAVALAALRSMSQDYQSTMGFDLCESAIERGDLDLIIAEASAVRSELRACRNRDEQFADWLPQHRVGHIIELEKLEPALSALADAIRALAEAEAEDFRK
jgi:hypothetical protein